MKYKMQSFLEWFSLNEKSISKLPQLSAHKRLFWLHWLQWHLDFYLPHTEFILDFYAASQQKPQLHLYSKSPSTKKELPIMAFSSFSIALHSLPIPDGSQLESFQEHIIPDIEIDAKEEKIYGRPGKLEFMEMRLIRGYAFTKSIAAYLIWERDMLTETPIFVRLSKGITLEDRSLIQLVEFDKYISEINKKTIPKK